MNNSLSKDEIGTLDLIERYSFMLDVNGNVPVPDVENQTSLNHIYWMLLTLKSEIGQDESFDDGKVGRWMGFCQYGLIISKLTTVEAERNYSRPLFRR